uniref:Gastrokine-1 n=1 Tax=Chelydra serpentina TaxID=8475 RepID=A0A8C3XNH5_CHESE
MVTSQEFLVHFDGEKLEKPKCLSLFVFKSKNVNENNQGNDGGNSHQTVSINNDKHVANIDSNNGWNSWNSVWDYGNGFMATRVFSKKSCIIAKMNKDVMPDIAVMPKLISERKKAGAQGPHPKELRFVVSKTRVPDLTPYGKHIEALCRGLPTYVAHEAKSECNPSVGLLMWLKLNMCLNTLLDQATFLNILQILDGNNSYYLATTHDC